MKGKVIVLKLKDSEYEFINKRRKHSYTDLVLYGYYALYYNQLSEHEQGYLKGLLAARGISLKEDAAEGGHI